MQDKTTKSGWKQRALDRQRQIRTLKKKLVRVVESRRQWRGKYYELKQQSKAVLGGKPRGYWYATRLVWLCVSVYYNSVCSLRSLSQMVVAVGLMLHLRLGRPCAATVRTWINKYGYYCYCIKPKEEVYSNKGLWAVIVDESVAVGQERLLVVLGVPLAKATFRSPLTRRSVTVLSLSIATSWKGAQIAEKLRAVARQVPVAYCVSDRGNNIRAALRQLGWYHVYDCTHLWAGVLEGIYKNEADYQRLLKELTALRKRWILSKHAHLMPPCGRESGRFINCFLQVAWIEKIQATRAALDEEALQALAFLNTHQALTGELTTLKTVIGAMAGELKAKGLNAQTLQACRSLMAPFTKGRLLCFKQRVLSEWEKYTQRLQKGETLLCCSDVIESFFSLIKLHLQKGAGQSLTESVLSMGGYPYTITQQRVHDALTQVHIHDIQTWKQQNTIPSLQQKRRAFYDKNCPKLPRAA